MATLSLVNVTAVSISPNPANINTSFAVAVTVAESTITLVPEIAYCGECFSGETYTQGG